MTIDTAQLLTDFGDWAWDRHGDVLSWYVRPLFLIPLAWFVYRRGTPVEGDARGHRRAYVEIGHSRTNPAGSTRERSPARGA